MWLQANQATAQAEATRKANSSKARVELEEQMKERQQQMLQQQVCTHVSVISVCDHDSHNFLITVSIQECCKKPSLAPNAS